LAKVRIRRFVGLLAGTHCFGSIPLGRALFVHVGGGPAPSVADGNQRAGDRVTISATKIEASMIDLPIDQCDGRLRSGKA
jgi:hypothetical protein